MNWDEFDKKFRKIEEKYGPEIRKDICAEFGSWRDLAFGILEMKLYDMTKYSDLCHALTLDAKDAMCFARGMNLTKKLEAFKSDYVENGPC